MYKKPVVADHVNAIVLKNFDIEYIGLKSGNGRALFCFASDDEISRNILRFGAYDLSSTLVFFDYLRRNDFRGSLFLDCGANLGTQSIYAHESGLFDTIIAIEPNPEVVNLLHANTAGLGIEIVPLALSDQGGKTVNLVFDRTNYGAGRLVAGVPEHGRSVAVTTTTIDDILGSRPVPAADIALWMDLEGAEANALLGARDLFIGRRVFLTCEIWAKASFVDPPGRFLKRLFGMGSHTIDRGTGDEVDLAAFLELDQQRDIAMIIGPLTRVQVDEAFELLD